MTNETKPEVKPSLLDKALQHDMTKRGGRASNAEELALALAWATDKITVTQVAAALGIKTGGVYPFLANVLKRHLQEREPAQG